MSEHGVPERLSSGSYSASSSASLAAMDVGLNSGGMDLAAASASVLAASSALAAASASARAFRSAAVSENSGGCEDANLDTSAASAAAAAASRSAAVSWDSPANSPGMRAVSSLALASAAALASASWRSRSSSRGANVGSLGGGAAGPAAKRTHEPGTRGGKRTLDGTADGAQFALSRTEHASGTSAPAARAGGANERQQAPISPSRSLVDLKTGSALNAQLKQGPTSPSARCASAPPLPGHPRCSPAWSTTSPKGQSTRVAATAGRAGRTWSSSRAGELDGPTCSANACLLTLRGHRRQHL